MSTEINYAVMRHGSHTGGQLNSQGIKEVENAAQKLDAFLEENHISKIEIWHSPKPRAQQTAEHLSQNLKVKNSLQEKDFLDCDKHKIQSNLPSSDTFVLLISHQPDIEYYLREKFMSRANVDTCDIFLGARKL